MHPTALGTVFFSIFVLRDSGAAREAADRASSGCGKASVVRPKSRRLFVLTTSLAFERRARVGQLGKLRAGQGSPVGPAGAALARTPRVASQNGVPPHTLRTSPGYDATKGTDALL